MIAGGHQTVTPCLNVMPVISRLRVEHTLADLIGLLPDREAEVAEHLRNVVRDLVAFRAINVV